MKINYKIKEWDEVLRPGDYFTVKPGYYDSCLGKAYKIQRIKNGQPIIHWENGFYEGVQNTMFFSNPGENILDKIQKIHPSLLANYKITLKP